MPDLWLQMKAEFVSLGGPGKTWLTEIEKLSHQVVKKKIFERLPPAIFGFPTWDKDDLAQLVITERLLARNQARYVFDTADSIDEARKILRNEINFVLSDRRVPNQVDNVWGNLEPRLAALGWESGKEDQDDGDNLHDKVVRIILSSKRLRNKGSQRYSALFAGSVLDEMANQIHEVGPRLKAGSIQKCLRTALTIISPAQSIDDVTSFEDNTEVSEERLLKSEENLRMERSQYGTRRYELARDVCEKLDSETLEIIFQKAHGANQSEIGEILGLTRQTARYRIEEAQQQLFNEFKVLELDIEESREVLGAMLDILGVRLSEVNA